MDDSTLLTSTNAAVLRSQVLVIDDNPQYAKIFELLSDELRIDAHIVDSCGEALSHLQKEHCDLILMDWLMPRVDGPCCTKKVRQLAKYRKLPIIAVTGHLQASYELCIQLGMDDYLPIPFTYEQLQEKLYHWLPKR